MAANGEIPKEMQALRYSEPFKFSIVTAPVPEIGDDEVLLKVACCGVCGTDAHIHEGEFLAKFPLIPGHEVVGPVVKVGKNVKTLKIGDRVACDVSETCGKCFYCIRGKNLFCENLEFHGVMRDGGFADYAAFSAAKCFKIHNLTNEEATLLEPASCAVHGLDQLQPKVGSEALIIGAGPTGLVLAQLLKLNGCSRVVLAANKGIKTEIAKKLDAADEYVELDRSDPDAQWNKLKEDNPYGFDIVVEATGVESIANRLFDYVRRGGKLMIYGVYSQKARLNISLDKLMTNEITILSSFSQTFCFGRAVDYLDSGKVRVKEMVTATYGIEEYQKALDKMNSREAMKIAIVPKGAQ